MKRCQRGTGKKTITALSLWHGFFLWRPSETEAGDHTHQSYVTTLCVFYCPGKIQELETSSRKHYVPWWQWQALPCPLWPRWFGCCAEGHCWESSDIARKSCGKTHPWPWGPHFSPSPHAASCLSSGAAVRIPIHIPCWPHPCLLDLAPEMSCPHCHPQPGSAGHLWVWGDGYAGRGPCPRLPHCCPPQPHCAMTVGI